MKKSENYKTRLDASSKIKFLNRRTRQKILLEMQKETHGSGRFPSNCSNRVIIQKINFKHNVKFITRVTIAGPNYSGSE